MPQDPASLQNLRDIAVPEPPPLWPPAPGVWVLLIVLAAVVAAMVVFWRRRRADNAYRRAGLLLLGDARTTRDVNIVLKRVALAVFPRPEVAPLYGGEWAAFLDGSCRSVRFSPFGDLEDDAEAPREVRALARTWIRRHRAPAGG
jgi:cbb3-type cytochrome oxidase subunit 3